MARVQRLGLCFVSLEFTGNNSVSYNSHGAAVKGTAGQAGPPRVRAAQIWRLRGTLRQVLWFKRRARVSVDAHVSQICSNQAVASS